ncbi:MAG TPA: DDE-type integrase/transposase/recombinase [Gemmataceae bacterium]|nr:DDE-type integrase/transposase/recombinase [Gemmataceae bacterium]
MGEAQPEPTPAAPHGSAAEPAACDNSSPSAEVWPCTPASLSAVVDSEREASASVACVSRRCEAVSRFRRRRAELNRAAREAEGTQRSLVLDRVEESLAAGLSRTAALGCAAISPATWRNWRRWRQAGTPRLAPRGRPPRTATQSERQAALGFLAEHGSQVPLHALRQHLPGVPRAELADLRGRYQRVVRWRRDRFRGRLFWKRVGAVWSIDFTEPKEYIGGTDRWILAIRDLTSGYQLAWISFAQATAECVVQVLLALFIEHGPPLVLKSDNGSQFIAEATLSLLCTWHVEPLFNPPRRPAYNGGLERTHPILKGYTEAAAAAQGRPAGILREDLQTARQNANRFTRRLGDDGPTAAEAWHTRQPISPELRLAFRRTVEAHRPAARAVRGLSDDTALNHYQRAAIDRDAIRDALLDHDLLEITPRHSRGRQRPKPCAEMCLPSSTVSKVASLALLTSTTTVAASADSSGTAPGGATARLAPLLPLAPAAARSGPDRDKIACSLAPSRRESCTIAIASASLPELDDCPAPAAPAHREPAATNILRRLITPLILRLRRAKIR